MTTALWNGTSNTINHWVRSLNLVQRDGFTRQD